MSPWLCKWCYRLQAFSRCGKGQVSLSQSRLSPIVAHNNYKLRNLLFQLLPFKKKSQLFPEPLDLDENNCRRIPGVLRPSCHDILITIITWTWPLGKRRLRIWIRLPHIPFLTMARLFFGDWINEVILKALPLFPQITTYLAMTPNDTDKLVTLLGFLLILCFYYRNHKRSSLPLPPGPKKLPLLGNLLNMPTSQPWLKYIEWSKQFSRFPVLHLHSELIGLGLP